MRRTGGLWFCLDFGRAGEENWELGNLIIILALGLSAKCYGVPLAMCCEFELECENLNSGRALYIEMDTLCFGGKERVSESRQRLDGKGECLPIWRIRNTSRGRMHMM